jgi:hypothetical protein
MHGCRRNTVLVHLLLALACTHCGGDDTTPPGSVSTGLPSQQKLSAFDDEDAKAACEALNDSALVIISDSELIRSQCAALAIGTTAKVNTEKTQITLDIATCEMAAKQCESEPAKFDITAAGGRDESDCEDATANEQVMSCDATVSEYEACVSRVLRQAKQALANISCANGKVLLESDGAETKLDPQSFAECKLFSGKCPNVRITASLGE